MYIILDWILIITSTVVTLKSYNRIINDRHSSFANFIILVEYIFCCTPILFNYIMGVPEYKSIYWYQSFIPAMNNEAVAVIYDIYILLSIGLLYLYARYHDIHLAHKKEYLPMRNDSILTNKFFLLTIIVSPMVYIIMTGNVTAYFTYGISKERGLDGGQYTVIMGMLMLLSLYAFCNYFFSTKITKGKIVLLIVYSIAIAWLQGKRFILAIMAMVYFFYITRGELTKKQKKIMKLGLPILFIGLIAFCYFYLVVIRPLSDTSFDGVYEMLRVDFGRDDVIKFVIYKEFFLGVNILDYPGQTFLSTFLTFIPRSIWPTKPYPHYMYLTGEILQLSIHNIPAGTTPSWFEMCLANFGVLGFLIGIVSIPVFCIGADRIKSISGQMVGLVLVSALLTQSIDAYLIFLFIYIVQALIRRFWGSKRVKITWGK